jgi:hypothetical protein
MPGIFHFHTPYRVCGKWKFHFPSAWNSPWKKCGSFGFVRWCFHVKEALLKPMKRTIELVLLPSLTLVIGFVVSPFLKGIWDYAANAILPELSPQARLSLLATLAILCLVEGAWIWMLTSKKMLLKKYDVDKFWIGLYRHKQTGEKVCGTCLNKGIVSPLVSLSTVQFSCGTCKTIVLRCYVPDSKPAEKKPEEKKA